MCQVIDDNALLVTDQSMTNHQPVQLQKGGLRRAIDVDQFGRGHTVFQLLTKVRRRGDRCISRGTRDT